jgi:very-short-patch-repair endonuclease
LRLLFKGAGERSETEDCPQALEENMNNEFLPRNKKMNPYSRNLRNTATKQENHLWYDFLRQHPLRFNRQRIIGGYIVDFHCPKANLVIELDGSQHYEEDAIDYDNKRTEYLESLGITVIRFTNMDIDRNFDGVCQVIEQTILNQLRR